MPSKCIGCGKAATMHCPKCDELGLDRAPFCSQACFKSNWKAHKVVHKKKKGEISAEAVKKYNDGKKPDVLGTLLISAEQPRRCAAVSLSDNASKAVSFEFQEGNANRDDADGNGDGKNAPSSASESVAKIAPTFHAVVETVIGGAVFEAGVRAMREDRKRTLPSIDASEDDILDIDDEVREDLNAFREWLGVPTLKKDKKKLEKLVAEGVDPIAKYAIWTVSVLPLAGCDPRFPVCTVDIVRAADDGFFLATMDPVTGQPSVAPCDPDEVCTALETLTLAGKGTWGRKQIEAFSSVFCAASAGKMISESPESQAETIGLPGPSVPFRACTIISARDLTEISVKVNTMQFFEALNADGTADAATHEADAAAMATPVGGN